MQKIRRSHSATSGQAPTAATECEVLRPRNFAGAREVSAENSLMTKRALSAVAGFFGCCLSLSAQQTQSPEQLLFDGSTLNRPFLTLADRERFSFMTAFRWQTPVDFLSPFNPVEPRSVASPLSD